MGVDLIDFKMMGKKMVSINESERDEKKIYLLRSHLSDTLFVKHKVENEEDIVDDGDPINLLEGGWVS